MKYTKIFVVLSCQLIVLSLINAIYISLYLDINAIEKISLIFSLVNFSLLLFCNLINVSEKPCTYKLRIFLTVIIYIGLVTSLSIFLIHRWILQLDVENNERFILGSNLMVILVLFFLLLCIYNLQLISFERPKPLPEEQHLPERLPDEEQHLIDLED